MAHLREAGLVKVKHGRSGGYHLNQPPDRITVADVFRVFDEPNIDTRKVPMTEKLVERTCTPCRGGVPALTFEEAEALRVQALNWALFDEARRIERSFRFPNFREALAFVQRVGQLAEAEGHHPDVRFGWGYATVSLQTKKIKGLHENDFIMAAKIDRLAKKHDG
jgi:4a-hydroxytetrahydrobiopterin dehydratase